MAKTIRSRKDRRAAKRTATVGTAQYECTVIFEPAEEGGYLVDHQGRWPQR